MKVIKAIKLTSSNLISSTATELYSNWSSATTYGLAAKVIYLDSIWESLQADNTNNTPDNSVLFWVRTGPSNKAAMFDQQVSTQTVASTSLVVDLVFNESFNSLALLNIKANSASIAIYDNEDTLVYENDTNLDDTQIADWYSYFFEEYDLRSELVLTNLPVYRPNKVKLTLTGPDVAVGSFVIGSLVDIGLSQYGMTFGIRDYSTKETDDFGTTRFIERNYSKRMNASVFVNNGRLNYLSKLLASIRATPTVWIASTDERLSGSVVYGYYRDWDVEVAYPDNSLIRLEIEGLI